MAFDIILWRLRDGCFGKDAYSFRRLDHWDRASSVNRGEDPVGGQTPWRYSHQERKVYFLLPHRYLRPHQHHPDLIVCAVPEIMPSNKSGLINSTNCPTMAKFSQFSISSEYIGKRKATELANLKKLTRFTPCASRLAVRKLRMDEVWQKKKSKRTQPGSPNSQ